MQPRPRKKVCIQCRRAHTACDGQQPCRRCIGAGMADQCCPPPPGKPRGRYMTSGLAGAGGVPGAAGAGAPPQMPNIGMPALAPHALPAQTTFASSADPSAGAGLADSYAQPQAKKQRSEPNGGAAAGMTGMPPLYGGATTPTSTSTSMAAELSQIKSLMSMLIEQVREVKRENADLREEVLDMRMRLDDNDAIHKRQMDALRREVAAAGLKGPRKGRRSHDSSPLSSSSALSLSTTSLASNSGSTTANVLESALQRQAIMTTLPFVREYSEYLDSFVLNDVMTDAFAVFYMGEPKSVEELSVNPPVFVHASPACCALTGFAQEELIGKPIFMLCQTEKEMIFVILTRIFSKPTKPTGEIFVTTMTWATKDKRALVVRLRHQIFYNKQRQPKWYFVVVESVLDDDAPEPQRSLSDILHNPSELQRFKSQFSAFFDSLYTTKTVTTTVTTLHHAGPGAHALMGSSIPAAFPPSSTTSSTTTFSAFPAMSHHFPHAAVGSSSSAMIGAAQYYYHQQQPPQLGPVSSDDNSPSMSASSSFDSSSPESNPLDPAVLASSSSSSSTLSSMSSSMSTQAWSNITLAELLEDDECRAILQEQKRKAAENHQLQLQQQQINQRVNLTSSGGGGSGKSLADQSLEELLDEFVPRTVQPS